jgi:Spy/CpxP family protein refolding chaperone
MRFKMIVTLTFVASLSLFAGSSAAQRPAQNPPPQPPPAQSAQGERPLGPVITGPGMMPPGMMQMMGPMGRAQGAGGRGQGPGGPLQMVSRLMMALDDTRVRAMLGLTDQQADSLRKIVVDTETFTIRTGATIAVDSIDLRELLRADKPDRAAVMGKGDEISKFTSQLINRYLDAVLAAKAILTPEQQKLIRTYMEGGAPSPLATPSRP